MTAAQEQEAQVARDIFLYTRGLNRGAMALQLFTVLVALAAISLSLLVAAYAGQANGPERWPSSELLKQLAFLSALFTAIYTGFCVRAKAADLRDAYRLIATDLLRYRVGELTINQLISSYARAEKIVGHVEVEGIGNRDPEPEASGSSASPGSSIAATP